MQQRQPNTCLRQPNDQTKRNKVFAENDEQAYLMSSFKPKS